MFNCKAVINEISIIDNKLNLEAIFKCPYNVSVISPKVKLVFECGGKTRRLPLFVKKYFRIQQSDLCMINCSYSFALDELYYNYTCDKDITVRIDFYYGTNEIVGIPFSISSSSNFLQSNKNVEIDEENIDYESFETSEFTQNLSLNATDEERQKDAYQVGFDFDNNRIIIHQVPENRDAFDFVQNSKIVVPLIRFVFFVLRIAISIVLIPYFVVDGFLAAIDVTPKHRIAKTGSRTKDILTQIQLNFSMFLRKNKKKETIKEKIFNLLCVFVNVYFKLQSGKPIVENQIFFVSGRRDTLGGNLECVYNYIKDRKDIEFKFLLFSDSEGHWNPKNLFKFLKLYATSKVVLVDDYFRLLDLVTKRDGVKVFQLWHACGAFKTFGFSRLGRKGGAKQTSVSHRMYDYATVSSTEIIRHYAEGFGLSDENVVATGIPRTDVFFDEEYKKNIQASFYAKYPQLKNKKIMIFAPTFRGNGQMTAYYPVEAFHAVDMYESLGGEYAIIIKLHPFCKERFEVPQEYSDYIIDLTDKDEINNLLFVADLLVTDYSSSIFEASLLNVPMLFYAFDLYDYISSRDFYYDFESFVPGKIVYSEKALIDCINADDFDKEKIDDFKYKFFDELDGKSTERVSNLILENLNN